eukprot:95410_1
MSDNESNKELAAAAKKRGNGHYSKKEWDEAIAEYTKAIELYDKDHTYYSNRSACYAASNKFDEALADGNKCVELKPDWAKGYGRVGYAQFKLDKLDEAKKKTYEAGLKIDADNSTLKEGLAECEQAMSEPKGKGLFGPQIWQTISLDPELRPFMNDKDFVNKINMLNANPQMAMQMGILNDPKIKKVFEKLMGMSFGAGGPGGGDDDHKDDHEHGPNCSHDHGTEQPENPHESTSSDTKKEEPKEPTPEPEPELTEEEKKEREELRLQEEEARLKQEGALKCKEEGNALYKEKKYEEAISKYRQAQELDEKKAQFVLNESAALFMMEKWDETIACCQRTIDVARTYFCELIWSYKAYIRMGSVEEKRGNLPKAVEYYKKAMVEKRDDKIRKRIKTLENKQKKKVAKALFDPELAEKLRTEGNTLFKEGNFAGAIEKYSDAIKRNPKDHRLYSNRATCFCKLMTWEAAMADCETAIKLDGTFVKAYIRKGKIHHCLKQYHKALDSYKKAEAIDPNIDDLITAKRDTLMAIQTRNASGQISEEERKRALQDPEVQSAMNDPEVSSVLLQAQSGDPTILMKAMRDRPHIKEKIELLMAAG